MTYIQRIQIKGHKVYLVVVEGVLAGNEDDQGRHEQSVGDVAGYATEARIAAGSSLIAQSRHDDDEGSIQRTHGQLHLRNILLYAPANGTYHPSLGDGAAEGGN